MSREQANSQFGDRKAAPAYRPADAIFGIRLTNDTA